MKPSTSRFAAAASLAISSTALAQSSIIIDVESPVLMPGQSTTVTMWAAFPSGDYAFGAIQTDLLSSEMGRGWSDPELFASMAGPGTSAGTVGAAGIEGILAGQLYVPIFGEADTANPIAFWRATYTAPAEVLEPMEVRLSTATSVFESYISRDSSERRSHLPTLTEGHATIHIIPAPAGAVVLGLGVLVAGRRRR